MPDASHQVRVVTAERIVTIAERDATAMAIRHGRVLDTGNARDLRERYPGAEVTDLGVATVVPGLNDAHMHRRAGPRRGTRNPVR